MPTVDLVDDSFVVAPRERLAGWVATPGRWREWWPDLELRVAEDRGAQGVRWTVEGALHGSAEVWLERWCDGTLVHCYLRADPVGPVPARAANRLRARYATAWKARLFALKDELEAGRAAGAPPAARVPSGERRDGGDDG